MKTKNLFGILMLFLFTFASISCDKDDMTDKVETIKMYVSVKEEGNSSYSKLPLNGIEGFVYKKGFEYTLKVEKTTLANPPADDSDVRYKLIEIITEQEK